MAKKSMITMSSTGSWKATKAFFNSIIYGDGIYQILEKYAVRGVELLSRSTPVDTGRTANSWSYEIKKTVDGWKIFWNNSSQSDGIPIVVLIRYGHATPNGAYVSPNDFVSPVTNKLFKDLCDDLWKEVKG